MNEQHIEDIISALYDMIQDARALPLGADKCILERDKVLDMLDEIIAQLPAELKQSRTIVESRNELIGQARREAEGIVRQAQQKAQELVAQEAIYQEARRQCQEMYNKTQAKIAELRKVSNDYMDDALRRTEEAIAQSLAEVQDTRAKFRALTETTDSHSADAEA
jgi:chromosome segregation ATPase